MQALDILYRKYYADVYRFAYMTTQNSATAEDIAQTVFLKITKCANQYRATGSAKGWILKITRSIALNVLRHNSWDHNANLDDLLNVPSQDDDFEGVEFLASLGELPPAMKEIVVLHVAYQLKHHEIAKILSKSPSAVRQQYRRAIGLLKEEYHKQN